MLTENKRNYRDPEVNDGNFYCDTADLLIFPAIIVSRGAVVSWVNAIYRESPR